MSVNFDSQDVKEIISCNTCTKPVDGIAYRTSCCHFICPSCAQDSFIRGNKCPVCKIKLTEGDIHEIIVGLKPAMDPLDSAFQIILQSPHWRKILDHHRQFSLNMVELSSFVNTQLALESNQESNVRQTLQTQISSLRNELVRILFRGVSVFIFSVGRRGNALNNFKRFKNLHRSKMKN